MDQGVEDLRLNWVEVTKFAPIEVFEGFVTEGLNCNWSLGKETSLWVVFVRHTNFGQLNVIEED